MVLDLTLAIIVLRACGFVEPGMARTVIAAAVNMWTINADPMAVQHADQHADPTPDPPAVQHADPMAQHAHPTPQGAPQAAAVVASMMASVKDVVRQIESGVFLETPAPLPGEASKTVLTAGFALMGGIEAMIGAPEPLMMVPREVCKR